MGWPTSRTPILPWRTVPREARSMVEDLRAVADDRRAALEWLAGEMEDEAEERDKEEAEDVPLLPLVEHTIQAVESDEFQKLLQSCGIKRPSAGEQYWRIPAKVRGAVLRTIAIVIRRGLEGNWEGLLEGLDEAHLNRGAKKEK